MRDLGFQLQFLINYVYQHLDEPLSVERLAKQVHWSKFHFHRQFRALTGMPIMSWVQILKLKRAAFQLAFQTDWTITRIAGQAGFENGESFSRAFKKQQGQSPSQFRRHPQWLPWITDNPLNNTFPEEGCQQPVQLTRQEKKLMAVLAQGQEPIMATAQKFRQWRQQSQESPIQRSGTFNLLLNETRFVAGSINRPVAQNRFGVDTFNVNEGLWACWIFKGPWESLEAEIDRFFRSELPEHNWQLDDRPLILEYLNLLPQVEAHQLQTRIMTPIEEV